MLTDTEGWGSSGGSVVENPPAVQEQWETQAQSLAWENPLGRAWQPPPGFLPGESHGQKWLVGYGPQGHKESDTTERLNTHIEGQ